MGRAIRCVDHDQGVAIDVEYEVVMQFARLLRLQADLLDQDGEHREATALRLRAARSERDVVAGL